MKDNTAKVAPADPASLLSLATALDEEREKLEHGVPRIATGWERLDRALGGGLEAPSFTVLGGPPKAFKSRIAQMIAVRHVEAGGVAYVLDLENGRRRVLRQILCRRSQLGAKEYLEARKNPDAAVFSSREAVERWRSADRWIVETLGPRFLIEHKQPENIEARFALAAKLAKGAKIPHPLVVIDSLQKLRGDPRDDRRTAIDKWIGLFERLRYDHEAVILATSEIRRGKEGYAAREDTFKESGGIEYAADLAMTLSRPAADEDGERVSTLRIELARDCEEDPGSDIASYAPLRPWYGLEERDPVERARTGRRGPKATKRVEAEEFLGNVLGGGRVKAADVKRRATDAAIAMATLQRAREALGIIIEGDYWRMP